MSNKKDILKKIFWSVLTIMLMCVLVFITILLNESKEKRVIEKRFKNIVLLIADEAEKKYLDGQIKENEISCDDLSSINKEDYGVCNVSFDQKGKAEITLIGKNDYKGLYVYEGTKEEVKVVSEEKTLEYDVKSYSGAYDGKEHGVIVSSIGKVKYGLKEGEYNLDESPKRIDAGSTIVYYQISKPGYKTITSSDKITISKADNPIKISGKLFEITNNEEELITVSNAIGNVCYSLEEKINSCENTMEIPKAKEVGSYTIYYYALGNENHKERSGEVTTIISKTTKPVVKEENILKISQNTQKYIYPTEGTISISENVSKGNISCESNDTQIATCKVEKDIIKVIPGKKEGSTDIIIKSEATDNYNSSSIVHKAIVENGVLSYHAEGYKGVYDGETHGIIVTSVDSIIKYGTTEGTYNLTSSPTRTDAGTTTVYYQISKPGYKTVTGSEDIVIDKKENELIISSGSETYTYPTSNTFTVTKNTSNGTLSCESSNINIATCSVSGTTVTVTPGTASGNANITVKSAATTNYNAASVTHIATINKGTLSYTAEGYTGNYDGNPHGITVTSAGSTIKYGTTEGTYNETSSPIRTDAGTTKVYFQITKPGYNTVTGSKDIVITKANNQLTISKSTGTYTYPTSDTFTVTKNISNGALSCESSNQSIATCKVTGTTVTVIPGTTSGNADITVKSAATTNYNAASITHTATINKGTLSYTAEGYTGNYDGNAHGITVTSAGSTIKYGTTEGTYNETSSPTRTDAGTTKVYFQITKPGYNTVTGSKDIVINKIANTLTISASTATYTYPISGTFTVTKNTGNGTLSCESNNQSIATCKVTGTTITVIPGTTSGNANITVKSATTTNYNAASVIHKATVESGTIAYEASGYNGIYDGEAHGIIVTSAGSTIKYGTTEGTYNLTSSPTREDVGTTTVYFQITKTGYDTIVGSKDIVITKANNQLTISKSIGTYTYPTSDTFTVTKNVSNGALSCESSNQSVATCKVTGTTVTVTPGTASGNANITVKSASTTNYNAASVTHIATINKGTLSYTAEGYTGNYDGNPHGITVTSAGSTIKYGTTEGTYNETSSPIRTDAGTTKVYFQITKPGYNTVTGSKDIVINKIANTLTISAATATYTYPISGTFTVTKNTGNGNLSCESSNQSIATCKVTGTTITVIPGKTSGNANITVKSAATTNYNAASVTHVATINKGTLSYTAEGYTGNYDGNPHGITVTSTGSTIKYGTAEGTYDLTSSPTRTDAGTTKVYFQIIKPGYNTVTGSKDIVINKIANTLTISAATATYTYPISGTFTVTKNTGNGTLSCESNNQSIATCKVTGTTITVIPGTTSGNANITVKSAATTNYNAASVTHTATINKGTLSYTAEGYTGNYDGNAHGITVTSAGATIKYGTTEGTYNLTSSPTRTDAGTTKVYFQITKAGYDTIVGSKDIVITKANNQLTISKSTGEYTYPTSDTFTVTKNTSNGALSCESSNTNIATCSISGTTVTVTPGTTSGNANITVKSAATTNYNAASITHTATINKGTLSYTAEGYTGNYDGNPHGITVTSAGSTIKYGTTEGTYNETSSPIRTDAGTTKVYFQITKPGYNTVTGSKDIVITKANNQLTISKSTGTYTYPTSDTFTITKNTSNGALSCESSNQSIATCKVTGTTITVIPGTTSGNADITVKSAATTNYNAASVTHVATINKGTLSYTAEGYTGNYDGNPHGITVTSTGSTIKYGTTEGTYNETSSPTRTDAGTTKVYFQITKPGYNTVNGSKDIVINKIANTLTISAATATYTYPTSGTFTVTKNTGNGTLSCESSNTNIATCSVSGTTVTVTPGTTSGNVNITVKSAATTNYNAASITHTATINKGTLSYTADGHTGNYDGKAHGITVTSAGSTIKYGTAEGTYDLTSSPTRTDAGTTKVYFQITKPGYNTVTGNKDIVINKIANTLTISTPTGTYTYPTNDTFTVTKNTSEGTLSCESSNTNIATCSISGTTVTVIPGTTSGNANITVKSAATTNYNAASITHTATINKGTLSYTADGYTGNYDGNSHGITVTSAGSTIKYGTTEGTYNLTSSPTRTDAGTTKVYFQITKPGYNTVTGSKDIVINKIANTLTISAATATYTYPSSDTFTVTRNTSNGALSCESSNTNIATCSISGTTVTVTPGTTSGNTNITVKSAATTNYNAASITHTATINKGTLSYTAEGYTGNYDGNAHGIIVTSSGSTIKYGTTEGTYNLTSSPTRTDAGTTKVYFQITKPGYNTVTGSKDIFINKLEDLTNIPTVLNVGSGEIITYNMLNGLGNISCVSQDSPIATCNIQNGVISIEGKELGSTTVNLRIEESSNNILINKIINVRTIIKCTFDGELVQGDEYVNGQYTYRYMQENTGSSWKNISGDGWGVILTDKISTTPVTTPLCTTINDKPIVSMSYMFKDSQATSLDLSSFNTSKVTNMSYMFDSSQATNLDLSSFDTSKVTNMSSMFCSSQALNLDLSSFDTSQVTNMRWMFYDSEATSLDLSNFNTSNVVNMSSMFVSIKVTNLDLSSFNTSKVINMTHMFAYNKITSLDLSNFDTSKVTNMSYMFARFAGTSLNLSNFNTSNVTNMSGMFQGSRATSLDLSNFDTSKVTNMSYMFDSSQATIIDLSSFDTSKVTNMYSMFGYSQATTLDLSSFDTSNVTNMSRMFSSSKAPSLDLSSFDTSKVTDMSYMFSSSKATTGYARTQADADKFNDAAETNIPSTLTFIVKPSSSAMGNRMISTIANLKGSSS